MRRVSTRSFCCQLPEDWRVQAEAARIVCEGPAGEILEASDTRVDGPPQEGRLRAWLRRVVAPAILRRRRREAVRALRHLLAAPALETTCPPGAAPLPRGPWARISTGQATDGRTFFGGAVLSDTRCVVLLTLEAPVSEANGRTFSSILASCEPLPEPSSPPHR